ncbi:MAG TPA: phytanoyl-CoA dioxygenase family protein [Saprospiraceae bacterium]|nr:phytanoyl-CoA dioxygenase family protein [Saprospiraceae bacterium]
MLRKTFLDPELEARFQKDGYVIVPFLSEEEVVRLKQAFFDLLPMSGGNILAGETGVDLDEITYDFTFIDKNPDFKRKVFKIIADHFQPHADRLLNQYRPIIANYIRKKETGGEVPLHQNWAFVDETQATSVSIWCPLVDSNEENGTLQLVPGSHKRYGQHRGPMVPWELEGIKKEIIDKYLVPANIKAGQAVVLDDSIVHYSAINKTQRLRLAIQLIMLPEKMPSIHYHLDHQQSTDQIQVLEVDHDFYMEFNPWKKPEKVKRVGTVPFTPRQLTEKEFANQLFRQRFDERPPKRGMLNRLKALFN